MRAKIKIIIKKDSKPLKKEDFKNKKDYLSIGMRYILEYKYLEASKWLLLSEDSFEKYYLLGLINLSLGQEKEGREFLEESKKYKKITDLEISFI